jgi:hypothetical protein
VNFVAQHGLEGESNEDKTDWGGCCLGDKAGIDARREGKQRSGQRAKLFISELAAWFSPLRHELDRFSRSHELESMQ